MGRPRNPDRVKAMELWLNSEPNTLKVKDIAAQLGYPESTVRKWKSEDCWEKERSEKKKRSAPLSKRRKGAPKGSANASGHGAPKGNKNAIGNNGGPPEGNKNAVGNGAPPGNQNAVTHGGYAAILFDTFDDDEHSLAAQMEPDEEKLLMDEIILLTVRERRILKRIDDAQKAPFAISSTIRSESKRAFASKEDEALYIELIREKIDSGERLPGRDYKITTETEGSYSIILKLEEALTRCQAQKKKAIDSLSLIRQANGMSKGSGLADDWIASVMETAEDDDGDQP